MQDKDWQADLRLLQRRERKARQILGVSDSDGAERIKRAWRKLSLEHHPDNNASSLESHRRFILVNCAYMFLTEGKGCEELDAVQVLSGCTTGKGNLFLRDYGKMVFTFAVRSSGRAVRVCLKHKTEPNIEQTPEGSQERRNREIQYMLQQPADELFSVREEIIPLPETARIHESALCELCSEMVMETRTRTVAGSLLCIPCAESAEKKGRKYP